MIGNMISIIRKQKGITKTKLSELTGINVGHLTHIEKGERNPSHKALLSICQALDIPYEELLHTYDKNLSIEQEKYNYLNYIAYNKIPAFSNLEDFVECPAKFSKAAFAYKVPNNDMDPLIKKDDLVFVEIAGLLSNKEIGIFKVDNNFLIRKLLYRKNGLVLRAENNEVPDIDLNLVKDFYIIGKIYL